MASQLLSNFPKTVGSRMYKGLAVVIHPLPNELHWEAKGDALQPSNDAASQLPNFPPLKGGYSVGKLCPPIGGGPSQDVGITEAVNPNTQLRTIEQLHAFLGSEHNSFTWNWSGSGNKFLGKCVHSKLLHSSIYIPSQGDWA